MADSLGDLVVQLNADFGDVSSQLGDLVDNFDNLGDSASNAADSLSNVQEASDDAGGKFEELESKGESLLKTLAGFAGITLSVAGALKLLQEALNISATTERATIALGALRGSEEQARLEMAGLADLANKFGVSFEGLVKIDQRFAAFGLNVEQTTAAMHLAIEAAAAMNSDVENTGRTLDLIVSSGIASRRIMSSLGVDMRDLAKAMGVTETEAARLLRTLDVSDRLEAMQVAMKKYGDVAEEQSKSMSASWQRFGNNFKAVLQDIGDNLKPVGMAIADAFSKFLEMTHGTMSGKAPLETVKTLGGLQDLAKALGIDFKLLDEQYKKGLSETPYGPAQAKLLDEYRIKLQLLIDAKRVDQTASDNAKKAQEAAAHAEAMKYVKPGEKPTEGQSPADFDKMLLMRHNVAINLARETAAIDIDIKKQTTVAAVEQERLRVEGEARLRHLSVEQEVNQLLDLNERKRTIEEGALRAKMAIPGRMVEGVPEDTVERNKTIQKDINKVNEDAAAEAIKIKQKIPEEAQKALDAEIERERDHQDAMVAIDKAGAEERLKVGLIGEEEAVSELRGFNEQKLNNALDAIKKQRVGRETNQDETRRLDKEELSARDTYALEEQKLDAEIANYRMALVKDKQKALEIEAKSDAEHGRSQLEQDRKTNDELLSQHRITADEHYRIDQELNDREDVLAKAAISRQKILLFQQLWMDPSKAKEFESAIAALDAELRKMEDATANRKGLDALKEQDRAWKDLGMTSTAALKTIAAGAQKNMDAIRAQGASVYQLAQAYQKVLEAQIKQNTEMGRDSNEQSVRLLELKIGTDLWNASLNNLGKSLNDLYADFKKDFGALAGEVAKAIVDGEKFGKLWHTIWTQFATDILTVVIQALERLILKMAVVQIVIAALNKLTGGALDASNADDAKKRIATSADEAAAGAAASVFENYPWPSSAILAPIAAGIAGGMTEALGHAFDLAETGADVARTGPVIAHAGETILSAGQTSKLGSMIDSGELGAKGGDRGGDTHFHINGATKSLMDEVLNYQIKNGRRSGVPW